MKNNHIHVTRHPDGWQVKRQGAERASFVTPTQKQAEQLGRSLSRRESGELYVHGRDGKILRRDSHGNDPCPPRDKR